tara:strand:+ start:283 stop:477 length:195 start_codon:yes stop_codon:yes gene_type:complete
MKKLVALLTIAYVTVAVIDPASTALIPDLVSSLGKGHGMDRTELTHFMADMNSMGIGFFSGTDI